MTSKVLADLVSLLALDPIEENIYRGQSQDLGWGTVFGGQVLGQSLSAAVQTVPPDRHVHSLHAYFLRPGDVTKPIVYLVDRLRDGKSFTTRRCVAVQSGSPILNMSASFQIDEPGFEHQDEMPAAPPPETVPTEQERARALADRLPPPLLARATRERPFEMRPILAEGEDPLRPTPRPARRMVWQRAVSRLPDDPGLHRYLLCYASDFGLVGTALLPHAVNWITPGLQIASLDHCMYFHQPFRVDEWLLYVMDSPAAHGARGLARGAFYTQEGRLVASVVQEGLIRKR